MKKDDMVMWVAVAAGGFALYWYLTKYGPNGAVTDSSGNPIVGAVSYWDTWFGGVAAGTAGTVAGAATQTPAQVFAAVAADTTFWNTLSAKYGTQFGAGLQAVMSQYATTPTDAPPSLYASATSVSSLENAIDAAGGPVTSTTPVTITPLPPPPPTSLTPPGMVAQALIASSGGNPATLLNAFQWNYYYAQKFGQPGSPITFSGVNMSQPISVSDYVSLMQQAGYIDSAGNPLVSTGPAINTPATMPIGSANPGRNVFDTGTTGTPVGGGVNRLNPTPFGSAGTITRGAVTQEPMVALNTGVNGIVPTHGGMGMSFGGAFRPRKEWKN